MGMAIFYRWLLFRQRHLCFYLTGLKGLVERIVRVRVLVNYLKSFPIV
jgi:hypothetical protein